MLDFSTILSNAPVLYFFLGMIAVWVKSDLDIPQPLPKLFSLYLLLAIGFKGGHELHESGITAEVISILGICLIMAFLVPLYAFFILRFKFDVYNAAALAATYGSVSAVTFVTATSFLEAHNIKYGGHMVAAMALMESPAIIVGVMLSLIFTPTKTSDEQLSHQHKPSLKHILHESLFNGSVLLLVGSLIIGLVTGAQGWADVEPFHKIFKGILMLYLLDCGIVAAKRLKSLQGSVVFLIIFGILMPLFNGMIAIFLAKYVINASVGDAFLLCVLCASASYIAVPAALRTAIPKADPAIFIPVALGITFPFNIVIGLHLYYNIILYLW